MRKEGEEGVRGDESECGGGKGGVTLWREGGGIERGGGRRDGECGGLLSLAMVSHLN